MLVTNKIKIDIARQGFPPSLDAVQNDANARSVEITLLENGSEWTVPDGVSAAVSYVKPDGTSGLYDRLPNGVSAVEISGSTIRFTMAPQMLTVPGLVRAAVVLINDTEQISTFPLDIHVAAQPGAGAKISENYYHYKTFEALNNAIGLLKELKTEDKSSLVAAINEVARKGGTGAGGGLTADERSTLIAIVNAIGTFSVPNGQALMDAFNAAWGNSGDSGGDTTEKTLTSISATYSGGSVPVGTAVSALTGIVVTAHYSDGSTDTVTGYTLSGSIADGSNTITVSYGGKTATFAVVGVAESAGDAELPTNELLEFVDLRNMTDEEVAGIKVGSANGILPTQGDGAYYSWASQLVASSNEYGAVLNRSLVYTNDASKSSAYTPDGDFTSATLIYESDGIGFPTASYAARSTQSNIASHWGYVNLKYKDSTGSEKGYGPVTLYKDEHPHANYEAVVVVISGTVMKYYLNGALAFEQDGAEIDGFGTWVVHPSNGNGACIEHGGGEIAVAGASYDKALSEVEVVELFEFFKTLEVSA